jgi:hypothetical protein
VDGWPASLGRHLHLGSKPLEEKIYQRLLPLAKGLHVFCKQQGVNGVELIGENGLFGGSPCGNRCIGKVEGLDTVPKPGLIRTPG